MISKYRLFHTEGARFVCRIILYRPIDGGGRITFKETSFKLKIKLKKSIFFI